MKKIMVLSLTTVLVYSVKAQNIDTTNQVQNKMAVKSVIENFLIAAGNYDADGISTMFTSKANISGASLNDGKWKSYTMSIEEFIAAIRSNTNPQKYSEPVSDWTIQVDGSQLAFVRADATLIRNNKPQRHNIDYFILIKEGAEWKILNGSYISTALE